MDLTQFQNTESQTQTEQTQTDGQSQEQANEIKIADLDGYQKFKLQGQEYTPEAFSQLLEEYKYLKDGRDEFSKDAEYFLNLKADLSRVKANPQLVGEFRKTYPERFHSYLDFVMAGGNPNDAAQGAKSQSQEGQAIPKELLEKISKVDLLEQRLHQADVQAANAQLDRILEKFSSKYPLATEKLVLAEATSKMESGYKMTDAAWERIFKETHEALEKRYADYSKSQLNKQINKGKLATDMGPGGSAPSSAPQTAMNFKDAEKEMLRFIQTGR